MQDFTPNLTSHQYHRFSAVSTELVAHFESAYSLLLTAGAAYTGIKEALINELDSLIAVHFAEVASHLDRVQASLDGLPGDFEFATVARDIHSAIRDNYTSTMSLAQASVGVRDSEGMAV